MQQMDQKCTYYDQFQYFQANAFIVFRYHRTLRSHMVIINVEKYTPFNQTFPTDFSAVNI